MPRRTQVFKKMPWTGGVNSSVDAGVLPINDLIQADNVVFTAAATRQKRQGFDYFDTSIPAVISRSSSGTTRTLVFAASVSTTGPTDQILVVGEAITVVTAGNSNYNSPNANVLSITTTTITNDTITYTFTGATSLTESTIADTAAVVTKTSPVLCVHDYWYFNSGNNAKTQLRMSVTAQGFIFSYDANGKRTQITMAGSGATPLAVTPVASADIRTFSNKLVVSFSGIGNTPKYYDAAAATGTWLDVPGAPDFSIMQEFQGRLFTNDKTNLDLLQFCAPFDLTQWQGIGDSGAIPFGQGDGDPVGIAAIMPPFREQLFIAKGSRLSRMTGDSPETYNIIVVSSGLGAVSHRACVTFDMDDLFFASQRGYHSVITTQSFGDFLGKFLSKRIQPTFNGWNHQQFQFMQGAYIAPLSSVAWTVAEPGHSAPNAIWLFNPGIQNEDGEPGVWYRWPAINARSITTVLQNGSVRVFCGTSNGRLMVGQNTKYTDFGSTGIPYRVKTGALYVDGDTNSVKAFKKFGLIFKPQGRFNFTAYFKVDNFPPQAIQFTQTNRGDRLGQNLVLGASLLGSNTNLAPYMKDVIGHGRGCSIEIFQSGVDAQVEVYGFAIEYESADTAEEVIQGG